MTSSDETHKITAYLCCGRSISTFSLEAKCLRARPSVLRLCRSVLRPKERQCSLHELSCGVEEDWPVTAIGHNPKRGAGNGAVHVNTPSPPDRENSCQ